MCFQRPGGWHFITYSRGANSIYTTPVARLATTEKRRAQEFTGSGEVGGEDGRRAPNGGLFSFVWEIGTRRYYYNVASFEKRHVCAREDKSYGTEKPRTGRGDQGNETRQCAIKHRPFGSKLQQHGKKKHFFFFRRAILKFNGFRLPGHKTCNKFVMNTIFWVNVLCYSYAHLNCYYRNTGRGAMVISHFRTFIFIYVKCIIQGFFTRIFPKSYRPNYGLDVNRTREAVLKNVRLISPDYRVDLGDFFSLLWFYF